MAPTEWDAREAEVVVVLDGVSGEGSRPTEGAIRLDGGRFAFSRGFLNMLRVLSYPRHFGACA